MLNEKTSNKLSFIINIAFFAVIIGIVYLVLKYVVVWLLPFIIGLGFALACKPIADFITKHLKINRKISSIIILVLVYIIIGLFLWILGANIIKSLIDFFSHLPTYYSSDIYPFFEYLSVKAVDLTKKLSPDILDQIYLMTDTISNNIRDFVVNLSKSTVSFIATLTSKLPRLLIAFIFTIMSSVFILVDYDKISLFISKQMSGKTLNIVLGAKTHLFKTIWGFIKAYSILLIITFLELTLGLSILRVNGVLAIAIIIAIADLLPVIGTGTIMLPWAIFSLVNGNMYIGLGLIILYAIITIVRNIMEPKIVGDQLGLHPLLTLITMYVGFILWGVLGMILLPVTTNIIVGLQRSKIIKIWED